MIYSKYYENERQYEEVLTVEQMMDYLAVGRTTAYKLLKAGKIKTFKIGNKHKIPLKSLQEYVDLERNIK